MYHATLLVPPRPEIHSIKYSKMRIEIPLGQGPFVQSNVSLTSLLMANTLTGVANVFSNTLLFLLRKCE